MSLMTARYLWCMCEGCACEGCACEGCMCEGCACEGCMCDDKLFEVDVEDT